MIQIAGGTRNLYAAEMNDHQAQQRLEQRLAGAALFQEEFDDTDDDTGEEVPRPVPILESDANSLVEQDAAAALIGLVLTDNSSTTDSWITAAESPH